MGNANSEHVVYEGTNAHLNVGSSSWRYADLTLTAAAPQSAFLPSGFVWENGNSGHVVFCGYDGHIHELYLNNGGSWHHVDLNIAAGGEPVSVGTPSGFVWERGNSEHVIYQGDDRHIYALYLNDSSSWRYTDVTLDAPVAPLAGGYSAGYPYGCAWENQSTEHVVYLRSQQPRF